MNNDLDCQHSHRARDLRTQDMRTQDIVYGLDYVEPQDDPRRLKAYFLGRMPPGITQCNVRIEGGRRI